MFSGGSISNLYAFLAARHKMFPAYKEKGISAIPGQLVMFTSDQCHYSIKSCASVCGLGTENCVEVPSDEGLVLYFNIFNFPRLISFVFWQLQFKCIANPL